MTSKEAIDELKMAAERLEISSHMDKNRRVAFDKAIEALKGPHRNEGKWQTDVYGMPYCTECAAYTLPGYASIHSIVKKFSYCPNCGAKMNVSREL